MSEERWAQVDEFISNQLSTSDAVLERALQASAAAGLRPINVSPNQGKLLFLLARAVGARNILELGTLGGYSAIWLARALPASGRLVTIEVEAATAEVARANFARAGMADRIDLRVGPALEVLPRLAGIRRFYAAIAEEPRVTATAIQTVGTKGYDGFAVILVIE